jgi:hypothetical protein
VILCQVGDTGSFDIPASLTSVVPGGHGPWVVTFTRNRAEHLEYSAVGQSIEAVVQTMWTTAAP